MTRQLTYHLMPGSPLPGEKVTASRDGSPTPASLKILTMVGPGVTEIRRDRRSLSPQVRRWSTVETVDVHNPGRPVQRRQIRVWHRELVVDHNGRPVLVPDDDQVGVIPPAEWCDVWVRRWRLALQHNRTELAGRWVDYSEAEQGRRLTRAAIGETVRIDRGIPTFMRAVAAYVAVSRAYAQHQQRVRVGTAILGLRDDGPQHVARVADALAGVRPPTVAHDPATAEWIMRFGTARTAATVEVDVHYLTTWLPLVAELDDPDETLSVAKFGAELRALHAELEHALGETRNVQWVGRCPARLADEDGTETSRVCGAGIWYDPHSPHSRIECPRCYTATGERRWLTLAKRIRATWPIDGRRRYTAADRWYAQTRTERIPTCRGCERTLTVQWKPAPERGDREPMWRPARLVCPHGCLAGGTSVAA